MNQTSYQDPFEDYKKRLAKRLAKRAEQDKSPDKHTENEKHDDINWFGVKVGSVKQSSESASPGKGVGKYLNLKRPLESGNSSEETKKQRKLGFGNFDQW